MATVLVMNASGKYSQMVNRNIDVPGVRKCARRDIILQTKASIVLVQESDLNIDSFLPRTGRYPKFASLGSKQAAILFRTQFFALINCSSLRREVSTLCEELEKTGILRTEHEVMPRMCLGQMQMLSNGVKFLFISWSGPAFSDIERRKDLAKDMLSLIDMYMVGKPVYLMIGGEFNLGYSEMAEILSEYQHFYLCECSKKEQYPNKSSHFITSKPIAAMVGDIHVFEVNKFLSQNYRVQQPDLKKILSHDSMFINLHF